MATRTRRTQRCIRGECRVDGFEARQDAERARDAVRPSFVTGRAFAQRLSRDANHLALLDEADAYIARNGLDLPEDPDARRQWPDPACLTDPIRALDLAKEGIRAVIWATGFSTDYSWLQVGALDQNGRPAHRRGISTEPGVYFLGLPWQSRRGSSFIWGVWHDAKFIADQIAIRHSYLAYAPSEHVEHTEKKSKLRGA